MGDMGFSQEVPYVSKGLYKAGDRFKEMEVTYCGSYNFSDDFGSKACYIFKDEEGNQLRWYTAAKRILEKDKKYLLNATVKMHKEYDDVGWVTILSRSYIKEC